jgi:hypothetical protein
MQSMTQANTKFALFKASDAVNFDQSGVMSAPEPGTFDVESAKELAEEGVVAQGANNELLFVGGGMSLTKVWFKSGFPLPRHSHDCACLYYILAGSVSMGNEVLEAGDGFFVGEDVPYTYKVGPQGVELLEFRAATEFGIRLLGANADWGKKALASARKAMPNWPSEPRPSEHK